MDFSMAAGILNPEFLNPDSKTFRVISGLGGKEELVLES